MITDRLVQHKKGGGESLDTVSVSHQPLSKSPYFIGLFRLKSPLSPFVLAISCRGKTGADRSLQRRRIKTEEKAKVVAVGWGTYVLDCCTSHLAARLI